MTFSSALRFVAGALVASSSAVGCGPARVQTPAAQPQTLIVALADEGGAPSHIVVSNAGGSVELKSPGESTRISGTSAPAAPSVMDEATVRKIFGETLNDLPRAAERFNLYFRFESDELTDESRALLPEIVRSLRGRPVPEVTVIGHTDTTGETAANYELGLKRASTVRALLVASGLEDSLVEAASHGEGDLLVPTPDNTLEPRNRRVEITVK